MLTEKETRIKIAIEYFISKGFTSKDKIIDAVKKSYNYEIIETKRVMKKLISEYTEKVKVLES